MIVKNLNELKKLVNELRVQNIKISTFNGTFDLLHDGHRDALNFSEKNSEKLIILVNSDRSVSLYKGPDRPIEEEKLRVMKIEIHFPNTYIYIFDDLNPLNILKEIKPDIHFIGPDWGKKTLEQDLIESLGGKVIHIKKNLDISTTKILQKKEGIKTNKKAIFFDRDGTLIVDKKYLTEINDIEFFPQTSKVLSDLMNDGYLLFIISNQSMVARKMASEKDAVAINNEIVNRLKLMGVEIQESYLDFSHPDKPSNSRKPNTEFLEKISSKYKVALKDCWVIGDKPSDVVFGKKGNTRTIQIKGNYGISEFSEFIVDNLEEAYQIISND